MELILWRHAEAEDGADDMARVLTPKGRRQAARMAQWLTAQLDGPVQVIASPALRTRATADALDMPYAIDWRIAPDASADQLLAASGWPDGHGIVILVGHNLAISVLAARLTGIMDTALDTVPDTASDTAPDTASDTVPDTAPQSALVLRRGAAWWFACDGVGTGRRPTLKAVMTPALLKPA